MRQDIKTVCSLIYDDMELMDFFYDQTENWALAKENFAKLEKLEYKDFDFGDFFISAVYNPARAVSSFAKLDKKSIEKRTCFLCAHNRPAEQKGLDYKGHYDILINPYPICPVHFTVVERRHTEQKIYGRMTDFFDLAAEFPSLTILFNGAKAGASAPDHFHFQMVGSDFFRQPIDKPMLPIIKKEVTESGKMSELFEFAEDVFARKGEELCNIFCEYRNGKWKLVVFPRIKHRPQQFFDGYLLTSPGALDMTGNLIIAREEDFKKITKEDIEDVFRQVSGY